MRTKKSLNDNHEIAFAIVDGIMAGSDDPCFKLYIDGTFCVNFKYKNEEEGILVHQKVPLYLLKDKAQILYWIGIEMDDIEMELFTGGW